MTESWHARLRSRLWHAVAHNLGLKIVSLAVAVAVWAWVQGSQEVEVRTRAVVSWELPEELVSVDPLRKSLVVTVRGSQGRARTVKRGAMSMEVDLTEAEAGPLSVDFNELRIDGVPNGLEVVQLSPPALDLTLEAPLTRRVKVKPLVMGEPAEGYRRASVEVEPDTVEIRGPESLVRGITEVPTDIIDISGATEPRTTAVPLAIKERTVAPVGGRSVQVRVEVEAEVATRRFEEVPVLVRDKGWSADVETVIVTLAGPVLEMGAVQAGQVSLIVGLPEGVDPEARQLTVDYTPGEDAGAVQITYPGSDRIEVRGLSPARFVLTRDDR